MELEKQATRFYEKLQSMDRMYEEYAKVMGLTYMSLTVLKMIYETHENCTQKRICEETHFPKQSVNMIIKSFLEQGYVELKEVPSDRRNKQIKLSEEGQIYADKIIGDLLKSENDAIKALSSEQQEQLIKIMDIYGSVFENSVADLILNSSKTQKKN